MLINLRNALMAGKRLPYDAEVEYLESTGTQWIDTGINAKQSLKIRAVFETNSTTSQFAYGVRAGDSTISCSTGVGTNVGLARWGASAYADAGPGGLVDITQDSSGVIVNGTSRRYNATQTVVEQSGYTMVVFAGRNSTTTVTANMVGKFYSCKIWDNEVLVRDFIPVRKGTVGYLYDRVSGKLFGNAGSGDFVRGQDVVPVEYLKGDGNAYINTGVPCAFTDTYKVVAGYNENTMSSALFGAAWAVRSVFVQMGVSPRDLYWHGMNPSSYHQFADGMNTIICGNGYITINGVTTTGSNYLNANEGNEIYLMGNSSFYSGSGPAKVRVSNFTITSQGGDDKLRLLSVRVGTDATSWEGAMMDVLTRRIYRNAGTGAFTYGNDLKYPIPAE